MTMTLNNELVLTCNYFPCFSLVLSRSSFSASDHLLKQCEAGFLTGLRNFNGVALSSACKNCNSVSRALKW